MPNYSYKCTNAECNHLLDIFQKLADKPLAFCPKCDHTLEKILHSVPFKGGGGGWCGSKSQR